MPSYKNIDSVFADNITNQEIVDEYSKVAPDYEQDVLEEGYIAHIATAGVIGDLFPEERDTKEILDIAAGTGLVAEELRKLGFRNIDALEPSEGMIELAKKKGLYKNLCNAGLSEAGLDFPDDKYDAITICGWHGPADPLNVSLEEMIRVVKPGGYICIVTRMHYVDCLDSYKNVLLPHCKDLEEKNKWKHVEFKGFQGYPFKNEGVKIVHQVC